MNPDTLPVQPLPILEGTQHKNKALIVNIFGGPGAGKTMMAARLFVALKSHHLEVANPEEYAKRAVWKGDSKMLDEQLILAGQIWKNLFETRHAVDVIILDSPILLAAVYGENKEDHHFVQAMCSFHRKDTRLNVVVTRPQGHYDPRGRRETEHEAAAVDTRVIERLNSLNETHLTLTGDDKNAEALARAIAAHRQNHGRLL